MKVFLSTCRLNERGFLRNQFELQITACEVRVYFFLHVYQHNLNEHLVNIHWTFVENSLIIHRTFNGIPKRRDGKWHRRSPRKSKWPLDVDGEKWHRLRCIWSAMNPRHCRNSRRMMVSNRSNYQRKELLPRRRRGADSNSDSRRNSISDYIAWRGIGSRNNQTRVEALEIWNNEKQGSIWNY